MPRPVEGFHTKDGRFFEDEQEAIIHEVIYVLTTRLIEWKDDETEFPETKSIPNEVLSSLLLKALQFIEVNRDEVLTYLAASKAIEDRITTPPVPSGESEGASESNSTSQTVQPTGQPAPRVPRLRK